METAYYFENCSYFLLPVLVKDEARLLAFLKNSGEWRETTAYSALETRYVLSYASRMTEPRDGRLRRFTYTQTESLPLYMFDARISSEMEKYGKSWSGLLPALGEISLFVFGTGIAFLEFRLLYGKMPVEEIIEFVFLFRSLRNNESKDYLQYPDGTISFQTAAERMLDKDKSGTEICFSNSSEVKKQANIYTMLDMELCGMQESTEEEIDRCRYLLMHGFSMRFVYEGHTVARNIDGGGDADMSTQYEMIYNAGGQSYWGGSQDGLVCLARKPYAYQYEHLTNDYRFLYLLLLDQRFASIAYISEFSEPLTKLTDIQRIHKKVADLKTRYAFRVVSDDHYNQTIYNRMYNVLELDNLIADLEDTKDQLNDVTQVEQNKHDRRFEGLLTALSLLAIFSALVDLSDYLDRFFTHTPKNSWISLVVNLSIICVALFLIFANRRKK